MCGIAGVLSASRIDERAVAQMAFAIAHRGPDDQGVWVDTEAGVGLANRRLAIIDLSPEGHQPMLSSNGRYALTFNGEIYNHRELRTELDEAGLSPERGWRGHSDTETLIELIANHGLERAIERCVGMFALALWDRKERRLALVRDRFGEKPLYYGWVGRNFLFGSELKVLSAHPQFEARIDRHAVGLLLSRTYIPAPFSIYERIFKLEPGCILTLDREAAGQPLDGPPKEGRSSDGLNLERYWSYRNVIVRGLDDPIDDEATALEELERTLASAIQRQSMADVPVGAFLSGGVDSSTIVGLYQKYSSVPVRTFSIGFEQKGFNEAQHAKRVAAYLGTVHNERYVTARDAQEVIPLLPKMYDEPFADSSQIPTYLVSRFAREHVTVALTGDGGDELFAGYNRHLMLPQLWQTLQRLPRSLRSAVGGPLGHVPSQLWSGLGALLPGRRQPHFGGKVQKALRVAASVGTFDDVYCTFLNEWSFEPSPLLGPGEAECPFDLKLGRPVPDTLRMMYCDAVSYLPDDILAKVDRASMAVSLETRVPFLDHRVAELAARIPLSLKVRNGKGKHILRQLLYDLVPQDLVDRPKAGFGIPVGEWIKGPLRFWAEDLLDPRRMAQECFFDPQIVQRRWQAHLSGRRDSTPALWAILMFQAWLRQQPEQLRKAA
jgi:asparagine synthase (glutamine-hydrolysing)